MSREIRPELVARGRRIQLRREELQWSQQDMITKLEQAGIDWAGSRTMTRAAYSHWETGRADIPASALAAVANVLEIPVAYLLGQQSQEEWFDVQAMQYYRGTSEELKPAALAALEALFRMSDQSRTTHGRKALDTED